MLFNIKNEQPANADCSLAKEMWDVSKEFETICSFHKCLLIYTNKKEHLV